MAPNKEEITEAESKPGTLENSVAIKKPSSHPVPPQQRDVYPYFVSTSVPELHDSLYRAVFQEILDHGVFFNEPQVKRASPFEYKSREEVTALMNFNLDEEKVNHEELLDIVRKVVKFSPHPSHPYKIDLHGAGLDPYGIIGDWIGTALSALVITYSLAPVFTLMEYEVERRVRDLLKYPGDSGDGLVVPGAAEGNGYAIQIALQAKFPQVKNKGILGAGISQPVLFVSEHGCPSVLGYSAWEGLGTNACIKVLTDEKGKMDVKDLEKKILLAEKEGKKPFLIIATAGTYFLGAIDPLDEIAKVAERHGLWLHVDGQLAGSIIFSEKQGHRLKGVERSDSFLWSADKGLCAPVTMAVLVTKASDIFKKTFSYGAQYVFLPNSLYNNAYWDKGDNTMQCTRRPDVVKLWLMWKAKGKLKLGRHVDYCYEMTGELVKELERRSDAFQLILPHFESHQVSFYYIPRVLRPYSISFREEILKKSKFTREMRKVLGLKGIMLTCIASLPRFHDSTPFFVFTLANSTLNRSDLVYLLDQIEYQSEDSSLQEVLRSHILGSSSYTLIQKMVPNFQMSKDKTGMIKQSQGEELEKAGRKRSSKIWRMPSVPEDRNSSNFVSSPIHLLHYDLFQKSINLILEKMTYWEDERKIDGIPAQNFRTPEQLLKEFDFSLEEDRTLGLMSERGLEGKLLEIFQDINKYSVHFSHPFYNYNLSQGLDPYTLMADYVIAIINSPSTFHEDNPIFCKMEEQLVSAIRKLVGYSGGGDGLVVAGGSTAIQIAMSLASVSKSRESKTIGLVASGQQLVCFVSKAGHYATAKGAFYMGFGLDNCIQIETTETGQMSTEALRVAVEKCVAEGKTPFFVLATAGTTVLGVFDPIDEIADICEEFNMWLHVDGSYGGATLTSSNQTAKQVKFKGLERSDSFNLNAHKVFGAVREASILVTRQKNVLHALSPLSAEDGIDIAKVYQGSWQDFDPECMQMFPDRRGNVFKMFFLWKAKGLKGLGEHTDAAYKLTEEVTMEILENRSHSFVLCNPGLVPQSPHVNFYFLPQRFRSVKQEERKSKEFIKDINLVTHEIIRRITLDRRMTIAKKEYTADEPTHIVLALTHSAINLQDVNYMLDVIEFYGQNL